MVGEHDPGGTDPDAPGVRADVRGEQFGRTAGQAVHVVMLGNPVTPVAGALKSLGDPNGAGDGIGGALAVLDPHEVKHGERQ